ncbi:MAG: hypothetical protein J6Q76_07045 [Clostridia bacterium]|nr:hypothetical protein [Clostridia bacterium]
MSKTFFKVLNKIYAAMMFTSFFAGFLPVIPFIVAIIIGGKVGSEIFSFIINYYYPWVIALGSLSIVVGLIAMYVGKIEDMSLKSMIKDKKEK